MPPFRPAHPLTRRAVLGGGLALASAAALTACGDDTPAELSDAAGAGTSAAPDGPWTWTDEIGQEIELDRAPQRIVAYADQAVALIGFGVRPVGTFGYQDPRTDASFAGVDLDGVEVIGTAYGEIDLERLAALQPDLIITTLYSEDTADTLYGFKDASQIETVRAIAPITGVLQAGSARDVIATNEKLVASLGVDVETGQVAEDRTAFEAAASALTQAAASGLTVVPIYAEDANLYYAKAPDDPSLRLYADQGVQFVPVTGEDYYWEIVSWENADTYSPDVVLYSERDSYTPEQLLDQPTFATLPAARAGQLHPWSFASMDYPSQTAYMTRLAGWLREDQRVV